MDGEHNEFALRSYRPEDLQGIVELLNTAERSDIDRDFTSPDDFAADMQSIGFNHETDTALILSADGRYAGYAEVAAGRKSPVRLRAYGVVHPDFRSKGLGRRLIEWTEERAKQFIHQAPRDVRVVLHHFAYAVREDAIALLNQQGYQHIRSFYRMSTELVERIKEPVIPEGISLRPIRNDLEEIRAALWVDYQSFRNHWGSVLESFEDYYARTLNRLKTRSQYDLSACRLAFAGDEPVGVAICSLWTQEDADKGWIDAIGVLKPWRGRQIGQALLMDELVELKKRGRKRAGLSVDAGNQTGALELYFRAGMHIDLEVQVYEKELRPGVDLMAHG
jgi:mycothiol synthase